jgi:hypothetical protein
MTYFETYAPVITWFVIRLMIVFSIIFCWALWQVDFVRAYPQAPFETDIYLELPQGIKTATGDSKDHVLKLLKNIYVQKQAGILWNSFFVDKLTLLGYTFLSIDDCVFFHGGIIFMVYVNDGIYVGVSIKKHCDGFYEFTQHALIDSIIEDMGIIDSKTKPVPVKVSL